MAWVCILVEAGLVVLMILAKIYLDTWGPHGARATKRARPQARLTNSPSLASELRCVGLVAACCDVVSSCAAVPWLLAAAPAAST